MVKRLLQVNYICLAMLLSFITLGYQTLWADGSRDMYPSDYYAKYGVTAGSAGDYRACLLSGITSSGSDPDLAAPFPTYGTLKVYAKAGEHIYVASSAMVVSDSKTKETYGRIDWRAPNGAKGSVTNVRKGGLIANRTQELAGPNINGSTTGYDAYKLTVAADQEGVWEIDFIGVTTTLGFATENPAKHKIETWEEEYGSTSLPYINAFDISVSNKADDAFIPGRVYANVLNLLMPSAFGGSNYACEWYTTLYVLTNTGYLYEVKPNGQNGHFSTFFANNKGVQVDPTGWVTDNSDFSTSKAIACYGGLPSYASYDSQLSGNQFKDSKVPTYDPRRPDRPSTRMVEGEEKVTDDITHKIFFTKPASDMPASAPAVYGKQVATTWLLTGLNAKDTPTLTNLNLVGKESNLPGVMGPEGVNLYFEANASGDYILEMTFGEGYANRVFSGVCQKGENVIEWDGLDGAGRNVPVANIVLAGKLKTAEIHFPFFDMENNKHGLLLNQLNADWSAIARDTIYWNDSNLAGVVKGASEDELDMSDGTDSPGHIWLNNQSNRGNNRIIDTWTYAQGASSESQSLSAVSHYIDLSINSITCEETSTHVGDPVSFVLEVENRAAGDVLFQGETVTVDADADSASVGVWFDGGGFYTTSVELISSDDPACQVKQQPSGEEYGLGFISLKHGKSAKILVTGYVSGALAHGKIQPMGFVMRPGDYFEVDAKNLASDGMPLNPAAEYEGMDSNNLLLLSEPIYVLNSAPSTVPDVTTVAAGQVATGNVLENDADPDLDPSLSIISYKINDVEGTIGSATPIYSGETELCGTLTLNADGTYSFSADGNYSGNVPEIYFAVSDGYEGSAAVTVADLIPGVDTSRLSIRVLPNHDPIVSPTTVSINRSGEKTYVPVSVTDEDGDDLTVSLAGADQAKFLWEHDSLFYVGASVTEPTTYEVDVEVNDGVRNPVTTSVHVTVNKNSAPTLTPTTVSISARQGIYTNYLLPVKIMDPEGDRVTNISLSGSNVSYFTVIDGNIYFRGTTQSVRSTGTKNYTFNATLTDEWGAAATILVVVNVNIIKGNLNASDAYAVADDIVYGETLASAFTRGANVSGSWTMKSNDFHYYEDDAILPVGSYTFDLLFEPAPGNENYISEEVPDVTFNVLPRPITLMSDSATKVYDGLALNGHSASVVEGSLVGADELVYSDFAGLINVDTVENTFVYGAAPGTSLHNYEVTVRYGALMVTPRPITVTSASAIKTFDGTPLVKEEASVSEGSLVGADEFVYSNFASVTVPGSVDNTFDVSAAAGVLLSNYEITKQYGTLTVEKSIIKDYEIALTPSTFKYDGSARQPSVVLSVDGSAIYESLYEVSYQDNVNASDTAKVIISGVENPYFILVGDTARFTISKRNVLFTSSSCERPYNGEPLTCESIQSIGGDGVVSGDEYTVTYSGSQENVGTSYNTINVTFDQDNYMVFTNFGTLKVTPKEVTLSPENVTWSDNSYVYDKEPHAPTAVITVDGLTMRPDLDYVVTYRDNVKAGTATAVVTPVASGNFSFAEYESNFAITPAILRVTDRSVASKVYDGTRDAQVIVNDFDGLVAGDDVSIAAEGLYDDKNAGEDKNVTITYVLSGDDRNNYQLETETDVYTKGVIETKTVVLTWNEPLTFVYDGEVKNVSATVSGTLPEETVEVNLYGGDRNVTGVGSYLTTAESLSDANYRLPAENAVAWNITKITEQPIVTLSDDTYVYDGTSHEPGVTVTVKGVAIAPSDYAVEYKNNVNAGDTAMVIVSALEGDEHVYSFANDTTYFSVAKRAVSYTSASDTKIFDGEPLVNEACTLVSGSIVAGDVPTIQYTGTQTNVGSSKNYFVVTFEPANYDVTCTYGDLTVTPKPIEIEATNVVWNDTVFIYDGQEHCPTSTITVGGLALRPYEDYAVFCSNNINVGDDVAHIAVRSQEGGNFVFTDYEVDFSILPRVIRVADSTVHAKVYDGTNVATVEVTGIANAVVGEDVSIVADAIYDDELVGTHKVVSIQYALSGEGKENYKLAYDHATYHEGVIEPKTVELIWNEPTTFIYDNTKKYGVSAEVKTGLTGVDVSVAAYANDSASLAGTYAAKALGLDNPNFVLPENDSLLWRILPQELLSSMFELKNDSFVYNAQSHKAEFDVLETLQFVETVDYEVSYQDESLAWTTSAPVNAGSYKVKITVLNPNYEASELDAWSMAIHKAVVRTPYELVTEKVYDRSDLAEVQLLPIEGVVNAEQVEVSVSAVYDTTSVEASQITVKFVLSGDDAANYELEHDSVVELGAILPKKVVVVGAMAADKEYDGNTEASVSMGVLNGVVDDDDVTAHVLSAHFKDSKFDEHIPVYVEYVLSGTDAANYWVKKDTLAADINRPAITPVWSVADAVYGLAVIGANPKVSMEPETEGVVSYQVDGELVSLGYILPAGFHEISAVFTLPDDAVIDCGTQNIVVEKKRVTLTSLDLTTDKKYDGTDTLLPVLTDSLLSGVVGEDELYVTSLSARYDGISVAEQREINVEVQLGGAELANYTIETIHQTGAIHPREITLSAYDSTKIYDGTPLVYDSVTIEGDGFVEGDLVSVHAIGSIVEPGFALNYIQYVLADDALEENYDITMFRGTLVVAKIPQTAPEITPVNESLSGMSDGKMIGLTTDMEMRSADEDYYSPVTNAEKLFAPGTYYVRKPESAYYAASDSAKVIILPGISEFNVVATLDPAALGRVTGSGDYPHHSRVTIAAYPEMGYHFVAWNDSITSNPYSFVLTADTHFVATVAPNEYHVVMMDGEEVLKTMDVHYGEVVTLDQLAYTPVKYGYEFKGWNREFPVTVALGDVVLEAEWTKVRYNVNVLAENGTVDPYEKAVPFEEQVTVTVTANAGYHFVSWSDGFELNSRVVEVVKDTALTALFEPNVHLLTVKSDNNILKTMNVAFGETVTEASLDVNPTKAGHDLLGWTPALPIVMPDSNVTVAALWEKRSFVVKTLAEHGTIERNLDNPVPYYEWVELTPVPDEGYHFSSWQDGSVMSPRSVKVYKDTTMTAYFDRNHYQIKVMDGDSLLYAQDVLFGDVVRDLNYTPEKSGYLFKKWNKKFPLTVGAADVVVEPVWERNSYHLNVLAENGTVGTYPTTVPFETMVELTVTPNEGYHFDSWQDGVAENPRSIQVVKDTNLVAVFAPNSYQLTVKDGGEVLKTLTLLYGSTVSSATLDVAPNKEGYSFAGWNPALPFVMGASDATVEAQWQKNSYVVTLDTVGVHGTVMAEFENPVAYESAVDMEAIPATGYHFVAWNDGVGTARRSVVVVKDTILSPVFEKNQVELVVMDREEVVKRIPLLYGDEVTEDLLAITLEREGYDFAGWNPTLPLVAGDEGMTIEAVWSLKQIELTISTEFENGRVIIDPEGSVSYGDVVTLTAEPSEGYHFVVWNDGDSTNPRPITVVSDTMLAPIFEKNQYEMVLVADGDTLNKVMVSYGDVIDEAMLGEAPAKEGYDFVGWTPELPYVVGTEPVVFEAQWSIKTFEITMDTLFENGSISLEYDDPVKYGDEITVTAVPSEGYHFKSWSDGSKENPRQVTILSDTAFTPIFSRNSYTLLVMNEADTMNVFTFFYKDTVRHEILDRLIPTKVGHDFIGWDAVLPIFMPAHDTVIRAQYIPKVYTVITKINGNVGKVKGEGNYDYGSLAVLNAIPNKGYHFVGWGNGKTSDSISFTVTSDTVVSAFFAKDVDEMMVDTLVIPALGYCPGTEDVMRYSLLTSEAPTEYRIIYDEEAKAVGFEDVDFSPILADNEIRVVIPDCPARTYKAKVQFRNGSNSLTPVFDVDVRVNLSNEYITDIWSDVVSAVNLENRFVEYQWFHNDVKVGGATAPYYCEKKGLTGSYYLEIITTEGESLRTCKKWFSNSSNTTLSVYPNPTVGYATVELSVDDGNAHHLVVTNAQGVVVLSTTFTGRKTQVDFGKYASGTYVVAVDGLSVKEIKK